MGTMGSRRRRIWDDPLSRIFPLVSMDMNALAFLGPNGSGKINPVY